MSEIDDLITEARKTGDLAALADYLRGRPMSPTGFVRTAAVSFGDGYTEDRSWLAVESAVIDKKLTEAQYTELRTIIGR